MVKQGEKAPDFTLVDSEGNAITLSKELGKQPILLYFYPMAFSPVCTNQLQEYAQSARQFNDINAKILAVSADLQYAIGAFKRELGAEFTMLSDPEKRVIAQYAGVVKDKGYSNRAYFILDKNGMIKWMKIMENPGKKVTNDELIEQLKKAM